jgi:mannosyl-oligosaccharide alpha-1,2-mannosidase
LFIDGKVVHSSNAAAEGHLVQTMQPLIVGQYPGHPEYSLFGNVSQLAVAHPSGPLEVNQVADLVSSMMKLSSNPSPSALRSLSSSSSSSIFAFYPLTDAASEIPDGKAVELVQGRHGKYHFPLVKGVQFTGVPIPLIDGINGRPVTEAMKAESDALGKTRREEIKAAMSFVWGSYKKYAWGRDELKPISHQGQDNWGGMGVTLVDSLDTLWIMGLTKEFEEAKEWVRTRLTFSNAGAVSVFETTIRELGGLLSAYDLSKDKVFLDKAVELGGLLSAAFDSKTGIPYGMVNLQSGQPAQGWAGSSAILSELGTLQLEFRNLAMASHNKALEQKSMKVMQLMSTKNPQHGLFPIKVDINSGHWADTHVTFGALGDSFYEYLLKVWIQGGKKEMWLREMYDKAMDGVVNVLLKASDMTGLAFLSDWNGHSNIRKMDHLVCFMPGTLALGAHTDPLGPDSPRAKRDLAIAKALMYTCREMYHRMKSGISPEYVEFPPGQDMIVGTTAPFYILRPETAESLFILNQLTGDPIYRDWAWEIFSAIEKHCKIPGGGYGALQDVNRPDRGVDDRMESFFLAETVKYLYLAQDPDRPIDLDHFVFNTEGERVIFVVVVVVVGGGGCKTRSPIAGIHNPLTSPPPPLSLPRSPSYEGVRS